MGAPSNEECLLPQNCGSCALFNGSLFLVTYTTISGFHPNGVSRFRVLQCDLVMVEAPLSCDRQHHMLSQQQSDVTAHRFPFFYASFSCNVFRNLVAQFLLPLEPVSRYSFHEVDKGTTIIPWRSFLSGSKFLPAGHGSARIRIQP